MTRAGVSAAHAEAIADAMRVAVSEGVASKADIHQLEGEIHRLEEHVRRPEEQMATKADLAPLETRLTVRVYGVAAGIVAANAALMFALLEVFGAPS